MVDDDPVVGKSVHRALSENKGYVIVTAQNAAQALERLREQAYDLVFTDIKMPGMDGVELAERVKAKRPWTPVVPSQAAKRAPSYLKNVALFAFAPFIGLAYAVMLPNVGTVMRVWAGVQVLRTRSHAQ